MIWLKFVLCLAIILFAGTRLARYGDAIAEKTGLGRIWIGLVLIAAITSMPELVTAVSSAALVGSSDLALGTLLGTCAFNLSIIALLDLLHQHTPVLSQVSSRHITSASLGILLAAIVLGGIFIGDKLPALTLGWVGIPSIIILVIYLVGIRRIYNNERNSQIMITQVSYPKYKDLSSVKVYVGFALAAIAIIAAGIWLSFIGDEIATTTGWGMTFVGSLFLAITTSMPELAVAVAAVRLGALDMAVADILGANMLDLAYIALVDLAYVQGPLLGSVSTGHLFTAAVVLVMSAIVIIGLRFHQKRKTFVFISWYAPALIGLYIFAAYALFTSGLGL